MDEVGCRFQARGLPPVLPAAALRDEETVSEASALDAPPPFAAAMQRGRRLLRLG